MTAATRPIRLEATRRDSRGQILFARLPAFATSVDLIDPSLLIYRRYRVIRLPSLNDGAIEKTERATR